MIKGDVKIGLALSGGGIRATLFHLGILKWMAENNMLENIVRITSVSGASIAIGLIYAHNSYKWPTSAEYLNRVLPRIRKVILSHDIQVLALGKLVYSPKYWNKKVNFVSKVMQNYWEMTGKISDLSKNPKWYINCTTFETGKRFRFSQNEMGDYQIGYVKKPELLIADAVAASAGFPILIGPYKLKTDQYTWENSFYTNQNWSRSQNKYIHLWDGGVYDNLGLESIYKMDQGGQLSEGLNYIIISNASGGIDYSKRNMGISGKSLKRLLDITMDQVNALRTRSVMDYIKRTKSGVYFNIGNSAEMITEKSCVDESVKKQLVSQCMTSSDAKYVRNYSTTLARPSDANMDLIIQHGYEVAKCTYLCYS